VALRPEVMQVIAGLELDLSDFVARRSAKRRGVRLAPAPIKSGRVEPQAFVARPDAQLHLLRLLDDLASDRLGEHVRHTA
jgi:hypothetical protein